MRTISRSSHLRLHIEAVNNHTLDPVPAEKLGHVKGGLLRHHNADKIEGSINASSGSARGDDAESTEAHRSSSSNRLTTRVGALEGHAALSVYVVLASELFFGRKLAATYRALEGRRPSGFS